MQHLDRRLPDKPDGERLVTPVALQTEGREAKYCGHKNQPRDADDVGVAREAPEIDAVEATPASVRHTREILTLSEPRAQDELGGESTSSGVECL